MQTVNRQLQHKNIRRFSVNKNGRLEEADLNEIVGRVRSVLAPLLRSSGAIALNITLSQKDLKIKAESGLMVAAALSLVRSALQTLSGSGELSLSTAQVDFTYHSILDGNDYRYGACASLVIAGRGIDGWCKLLDPLLAGGTGKGKDGDLSKAYRIIKEHHGSTKIERAPGQGTTITVYLPLARPDDTSARSAPEAA